MQEVIETAVTLAGTNRCIHQVCLPSAVVPVSEWAGALGCEPTNAKCSNGKGMRQS